MGHYRRQRSQELLDIINQPVAQHPGTEFHVMLKILCTNKPKHDRWLALHPLVRFHETPTPASWLNQVEVWFSVLTPGVLRDLRVTDIRQICRAH